MANDDPFWTAQRKKAALREADSSGQVADSMEVRKALMARVHSGEITLERAQSELARIKRGASAVGKTTRAQAFRNG